MKYVVRHGIVLALGLLVGTSIIIAAMLIPRLPAGAALIGILVGVASIILSAVRTTSSSIATLPDDLIIYLVRHGHTENLNSNLYQTRTDVPLSTHGREIANRLSLRFAAVPLLGTYTSTLSRTIDTALIICKEIDPPVPISHKTGLQEIDVGEWEGLRQDEVDRLYPGMRMRRQVNPVGVVPPGGEKFTTAQHRLERFIEEIRRRHPYGGAILIVAHQNILGLLVTLLLSCPPRLYRRFLIRPCGVTKITVKDGVTLLEFFNDVFHEYIESEEQLQLLGY